jgi:hypothetical protein
MTTTLHVFLPFCAAADRAMASAPAAATIGLDTLLKVLPSLHSLPGE